MKKTKSTITKLLKKATGLGKNPFCPKFIVVGVIKREPGKEIKTFHCPLEKLSTAKHYAHWCQKQGHVVNILSISKKYMTSIYG